MIRYVATLCCLISLLLTGCVEEPVSKTGEEQEQTQKAPDQIFKVGDIVKIGNTELIIKSAEYVKGDQHVPPKKGKVLKLEIEGKNNGNQSWYISNGDFNLYDEDGGKLEEYFSFDDNFLGGEVNQGKTISGKIYYDVPKEESFELIYKPNFLTNQEVKFNIQPSN